MNLDIFITIGSTLFVNESNCVHQFVNDCGRSHTTRCGQVEFLRFFKLANVAPTPYCMLKNGWLKYNCPGNLISPHLNLAL